MIPDSKIIIYTDGGSRGNPGPAAVGVVIQDASGTTIKEYGEQLDGDRTNNEAEYEAVIFALAKAKALFGKERTQDMVVEFRVDSELVVEQLSGEYKIKQEHLQLLYMQIHNLRFDFSSVSFMHILREENARADMLLNRALDADKERLF